MRRTKTTTNARGANRGIRKTLVSSVKIRSLAGRNTNAPAAVRSTGRGSATATNMRTKSNTKRAGIIIRSTFFISNPRRPHYAEQKSVSLSLSTSVAFGTKKNQATGRTRSATRHDIWPCCRAAAAVPRSPPTSDSSRRAPSRCASSQTSIAGCCCRRRRSLIRKEYDKHQQRFNTHTSSVSRSSCRLPPALPVIEI